MDVPAHIYVDGSKCDRESSFGRYSSTNSTAISDEMIVPDRITLVGGGRLVGHNNQPNDVIRDRITTAAKENIVPMPNKLTANEFPSGDVKVSRKSFKTKRTSDSQENLLNSAESLNGLNSSLAVDADPIRELKNVRRQMGRLSTRVAELEDDSRRKETREFGLWFLMASGLAIITFLLGRR